MAFEMNHNSTVAELDARSDHLLSPAGPTRIAGDGKTTSNAEESVKNAGLGVPTPGHSIWMLHAVIAVLNYDFCPWANRFVYWVREPIGFLGVAGLLALCCAMFLSAFAWMAVAGVAVVLVLGTAWPWVALRGLEARLTWESPRAREGESAQVRLTMRNRCPWPVWGITIRGGFREDGASTALARVGGLSEVSFTWEFTPVERGVYPTEPPVMETGFPFGLWSARRPVVVEQELLVWPRIVKLDGLPDLTESQPSEEHLTDRRAGDLGDLLGTRLFRQGDSLRRIHWSQSARHQRLIVTERQAGVEARVRLRVDATAEHHVGAGPDSSLNWTLRVAASICEILNSEHAHVDCVIGGEVICLSHSGGFRRLMDRMACVPESGFEEQATTPTLRTDAGCEIHCTTDRADACHQRTGSTPRGHRDVVIGTRSFADVTVSDDSSSNTVEVVSENSRRRPWLLIESDEGIGSIAGIFQRQWRHACRVA